MEIAIIASVIYHFIKEGNQLLGSSVTPLPKVKLETSIRALWKLSSLLDVIR